MSSDFQILCNDFGFDNVHYHFPIICTSRHRVLAMFGYDDMYDIPLEVEAMEMKVQLERMKSMFG